MINQLPASLKQSPSDSAKLYDLVILMGAAELINPMAFDLRMKPAANGVRLQHLARYLLEVMRLPLQQCDCQVL